MAAPNPYGGAPPPSPPPPAPVTEPVAVVSPQFCAQHVVPLTVRKVLGLPSGGFKVTDANDAVVLRVTRAVFNIGQHRVVYDAAGRPVLTMQERVFSMHNRWEVFKGNSTSAGDLLFTAKRSSIVQMRTELHVYLASNTAQEVCDFKVKGGYQDRTCDVYLGDSNTTIAQMNRQISVSNVLLGKDTLIVTVFPNVDYVFIAALAVILNEIHRQRQTD